MSRGPGAIERAIEAAFSNNPAETFSVDELAVLVYPGINTASKKHRVSVIRAADKVARRMHWVGVRAEHPGRHLVFFNLLNVRSYRLGKLRTNYLDASHSAAYHANKLDNPNHPEWEELQPGGIWWRHVEIQRAHAEGRDADAELMQADLENNVMRLHNARKERERVFYETTGDYP